MLARGSLLARVPGFWSQVQQGYANRICTSLPSSLRIAWKGVLKPRHFLGVRLAVMTMSWISSSDTWSMSIWRGNQRQSTVGVFDPALLPRGIGVAKPSGHGAHGSQQGVLGEGGIVVESDGLAQRRVDTGEHRQHDRNGLGGGLSGKPSCQRHARFALMENEHWPCTLTNDEVTLPSAALGSGLDMLGPFVDGDAILDGILRRSRSARAAAFVMAREVTPSPLRLLRCPVDEGVDRLAPHGPQARFVSALEPA